MSRSGVWDGDEGFGPERPLGAAPELPTGGTAGGDVEEIHPMGKEQPTAYGRSDPHHQERWLTARFRNYELQVLINPSSAVLVPCRASSLCYNSHHLREAFVYNVLISLCHILEFNRLKLGVNSLHFANMHLSFAWPCTTKPAIRVILGHWYYTSSECWINKRCIVRIGQYLKSKYWENLF